MIELPLSAIADVVGGDLAVAGAGRAVADVTIDSRTVGDGSLFVALPGERVDGHDFLAAAHGAGAAGALVRAGHPALDHAPAGLGLVAVDDPADALLGLGAWVRNEVNPRVIAVTGSSGKTTTKDLLRAAIAGSRRVVATRASYNNELGVPLTCCSLQPGTEVLVAELGARGSGHIARMAAIVGPTVGVVTTVGPSHLEMLGDLDGVARAKRELVEALPADGVAILNGDDPAVLAMATAAICRVVTYGLGADADVRADDVRLDAFARPLFSVRGVEVRLPLSGRHNVGNALAALAGAEAVGVDLRVAANGLSSTSVSRWRMELHTTPSGVTVINDAYNANPSSTLAALHALVAIQADGRRIAVLGHMAELGMGSEAAHTAVGRAAATLGTDVVAVGEGAVAIAAGAEQVGGVAVRRVPDADAAVRLLSDHLRAGDAVLVKASRAVGLERIAIAIADSGGTPAPDGEPSPRGTAAPRREG